MTADSDRTARFYRLVWPHAAVVLRVARVLTHSEADAEDLSQQTLLKAFKSLHTLREENGARQWVLTILRHCQIDRTRARKPEISYDALEIEFAAPDEAEHPRESDVEGVLESFSDEEVIRSLRRLPDEIRTTLLLVDVEGLPDADAAAILSVPVGTVKSRLHRGRRMLYQSLLPTAKRLRLAV